MLISQILVLIEEKYFLELNMFFFSDMDTQVRRLMKRNHYSQEEAEQRIAAQMALSEKCKRATHVVDNSGSSAETLRQVQKIRKELNSSWAFLLVRIAVVVIPVAIALLFYWFIQRIW